ncbi:MAG: hypothetical protein JOS17DRAFT_159467 [Linnemannia elongata]|nr:MAG: hypothetical protein JOS17DRAFT_159467 [Linnemannia elongata]
MCSYIYKPVFHVSFWAQVLMITSEPSSEVCCQAERAEPVKEAVIKKNASRTGRKRRDKQSKQPPFSLRLVPFSFPLFITLHSSSIHRPLILFFYSLPFSLPLFLSLSLPISFLLLLLLFLPTILHTLLYNSLSLVPNPAPGNPNSSFIRPVPTALSYNLQLYPTFLYPQSSPFLHTNLPHSRTTIPTTTVTNSSIKNGRDLNSPFEDWSSNIHAVITFLQPFFDDWRSYASLVSALLGVGVLIMENQVLLRMRMGRWEILGYILSRYYFYFPLLRCRVVSQRNKAAPIDNNMWLFPRLSSCLLADMCGSLFFTHIHVSFFSLLLLGCIVSKSYLAER